MAIRIPSKLSVSDLWTGVINRSIPIRSISQSEYNHLNENEKSKDMVYLVFSGKSATMMYRDQPIFSEQYRFGHGLKTDGPNVSVNAVSDFKGDNTLPMTAAGVLSTVGNIEAILSTI